LSCRLHTGVRGTWRQKYKGATGAISRVPAFF
jgi:hypothetical protein